MSDQELRMNMTALRRVDPYAQEIVDSATHVALYSFEELEWEKTSFEGALFVYRRSGEPSHSMLIMNRLNTENFIEPVSNGLDFQLEGPFLLYRNSRGRIFGIWVYDKDELVRLARKLKGLLAQQSGAREPAPRQSATAPAQPPAPAPVDIFSMLSKAQDDYNSNKGNNTNEPAAPRTAEVASQSVMDFFAKAGGGGQLPAPPSGPAIFMAAQRPGGAPPDVHEAPFLLQRLMSNPAHSVEHIESQQRSVTPQEVPGSVERRNGAFEKRDLVRKPDNTRTRSKKLNIHKGDNDRLDNEISFMRISSPKSSSPLATFLAGPESAMSNALDDSVRSISIINNETPQKPALMPPTMFTSTSAPQPPNDHDSRPEPLTRNQLLQAFNYLVKHDAEFVNKLHEAYVKSFSELVS